MDHRIDKLFAAQDSSGFRRIEFFAMSVADAGRYESSELSAGDVLFCVEQPQHRIDIDDSRRPQPEIFALATVRVIFRLFDHPRPHRIQMDVADKLAHVHFALAEDGFVAALKKMADPAVFAVVILTVSGQHAMHYSPDRVRPAFDQEMNVIRHQAKSVQEERQFILLGGQKREELFVIFASTKYLLPVIPTCDNVVKSTLDLDPCLACHVVGILQIDKRFCKICAEKQARPQDFKTK